MTREEFLRAMTFLGSIYEKAYEQDTVSAWFTFFHTETEENFTKAIMRYSSTHPKPPTIADLKQEVMAFSVPYIEISAAESWSLVERAIRKYGSYNTQEAMDSFDPITRKTVNAMGGFMALCMSSDEDDWTRTKYFRLFDELKGYHMDALTLPSSARSELEAERASSLDVRSDRLISFREAAGHILRIAEGRKEA